MGGSTQKKKRPKRETAKERRHTTHPPGVTSGDRVISAVTARREGAHPQTHTRACTPLQEQAGEEGVRQLGKRTHTHNRTPAERWLEFGGRERVCMCACVGVGVERSEKARMTSGTRGEWEKAPSRGASSGAHCPSKNKHTLKSRPMRAASEIISRTQLRHVQRKQQAGEQGHETSRRQRKQGEKRAACERSHEGEVKTAGWAT